MIGRMSVFAAAIVLAANGGAAGQLPGTGALAMPAVIERPAPPEAVEMWERSATNPLALFAYLDREAVRKSLEPRHYDSEKLGNLLLDLESMAVERLGDIGGVGLITRLEEYVGRKVAAKEWDAATTARLTIERIRLRAKGRDAYVQAMIDWVQSPEPVPPTGDSEQPPERSYEQQSKDYWRRVIDGARALGVVQATEAVPVLIAKRQAPGWNNTHLGFWLVRALARIGDHRALETMKQQLLLFAWYVQSAQYPLEPEEPDVAWAYWQTRTRGMTQDQAIQEMLRSLSDDPAPLQAVRILELTGEPAVPGLLRALAGSLGGRDPAAAGRLAGVALGRLRARQAVGPLRQAVRSGPPDMRKVAAQALAEIGDPSALPDLMQAATDPDRGVQMSAIDAIGMLGDPAAEGLLLTIAGTASDPNVRYTAAAALGKTGTPNAIPALQALADKEANENVRAAMRAAISKLGSK
jgi:hypothetical protein